MVFKKQTAYLAMLFVLLVTSSCKWIHLKKGADPQEPYVARVYDSYLYNSVLNSKYPGSMSSEDSIFWTKNFINVWIQDQLLLHQAKNNLPPKEMDFSTQVEDYKNSLIRYAYESRLIEQNLDTIISKQQIEEYYNEHPDDFKLNRNIVKIMYVVVWKDSTKQIQTLRKMITKPNLDMFDDYCRNYEFPAFNSDTSQWFYFNDILEIIPLKIENQATQLRFYSHTIDFTDDNYWYYGRVFSYKLQNEHSPMDLEQERLKRIILSRRKEALIKDLRRNIFEDAQADGAFEIF